MTGEGPRPLVAPAAVAQWIGGLTGAVAVTGGTGFVGSHLVDTLCAAGVKPRVLLRDPEHPRWIEGRPVHAVPGSLGDVTALEELVAGASTVIHLAGVLRAARAEEFDQGNRVGSENLIRAVEKSAPGARVVHVSSLAAAGPSQDPQGIGPEAEPAPISDYGRSKLAAELAVRRLAGDHSWVVLRPPAIYGPRDTDVLEFFRMASRGLCVTPSGERWITTAHVADVVRGVLAAAGGDHDRRMFHLGEPRPREMTDLLEVLAGAGDVKARMVTVPPALVTVAGAAGGLLRRLGWQGSALTPDKAREILARHWTARTTDSLAELGLGEGVPFAEGARETWAWYRERGWLR